MVSAFLATASFKIWGNIGNLMHSGSVTLSSGQSASHQCPPRLPLSARLILVHRPPPHSTGKRYQGPGWRAGLGGGEEWVGWWLSPSTPPPPPPPIVQPVGCLRFNLQELMLERSGPTSGTKSYLGQRPRIWPPHCGAPRCYPRVGGYGLDNKLIVPKSRIRTGGRMAAECRYTGGPPAPPPCIRSS
jgi:hypothetical protein